MNPEITGSNRLIDRLAKSTALDELADAIQPPIRTLLDSDGAVGTPLKNALHGTWLGHSLHPILTDVPVGAWTVGAVCDALELAGFAGYDRAGDVATTVGALGAVAASITGWADWSDTKDEPKRVGVAHASLNVLALSAYITSLVLRATGSRRAGTLISLAAYGVVGAGAYLGGELSTGMQLGVKHTAPVIEPPEEFNDVCAASDVAEGAMLKVDFAGLPVLVSRAFGEVAAVAAICTHRGGPLAEGKLEGTCVRCPWHGGQFSLRDGSVREGPPVFPLAHFAARERNGRIELCRAT